MQLIKNPDQFGSISAKPVIGVLDQVVESFKHSHICPELVNKQNFNPTVIVNQEQLYSAIKNIVQNAVESTDKNGKVEIELVSMDSNRLTLSVSDDGKGMSQAFITDRLFRPFDSTKGVSGMGMGVFQSREFFRSIEGDLKVTSKKGVGTRFMIELPVNL